MSTTNGAVYPPNGTVMPPTGKFRPSIGLPEIVALTATTGAVCESNFGPSEVKLTLTDGRPWYVALAMADVIRQSGIQPRQQLEVTKTGKGPLDWKIVPLQAHLSAAPAAPSHAAGIVPTVAQLPQTMQPQNNTASTPLAACFIEAIDAIREAQAYANRVGLGITFTSEDVRATAISCWISVTKGGR